jgi:hypothetical protein
MSEHSPFDATPDPKLGVLLRRALTAPHGAAFVARVRARLNQRQTGWEDELARWFWQGLVAASLVTMLTGWGLTHLGAGESADAAASASVADQLLDGSQPGANVILASMSTADNQ